MSEPTKREWVHDGPDIVNELGLVVASLWISPFDDKERDVHGQLIAAAPDLLEIVESLNEWFEANNSPWRDSLCCDGSTWHESVKAAIARAKGGAR